MSSNGWDLMVADYQRANTERRALVLAHPQVARRLTQAPLHFAMPEQWTGYLPPREYGGVPNDSPNRAALLAIINAAQQAHDDTQGDDSACPSH